MTISIFDLFKIGIGPSSSHTVGPMVAAAQFVEALAQQQTLNNVAKLKAEMFGSLGLTGNGHGTPKALVLGLMGERPSSINIDKIDDIIADVKANNHLYLFGLQGKAIAFSMEKDIVLHRRKTLPFHANGMRFSAFDAEGNELVARAYYSVGGGFILDETEAENGVIMEDDREDPYPFDSCATLLALCEQHNFTFAELMMENELAIDSRENINAKLDELWSVMQACVNRGCATEGILPGGLKVRRRARALYEKLKGRYDKKGDPLVVLDWVTLYALAVNEENAAGGRVVTAPTNGAAGIIPAVLHYYMGFVEGANLTGVRNFLLTAAAIGMLYKKNASISGAEVGCQGEVGSACSMAAGGLTAVMGGSCNQVENAAEIAMEHHLGLTCDPIGGLVQVPCIERNAVASVKAIHATRIALNNDESPHIVSLDKVIKTMKDTGRDMMTKYKETSRGGLAVNVIEVPINIIEC
ncbi:MAG: L-serine dehydratase [Cellvibrionaceae bacterium]|jgi:L-serine dehydratase